MSDRLPPHAESRGRARWGTAREAIRDGSRRPLPGNGVPRLSIAVSAVGVAAALLLVMVEFSAVAVVDVASGSCEVINDANPELADRCELSGLERNGGSFLLLAALAAFMAVGAGIGGSRPAAWALAAVGVLVLGWSLLVDLPVTDETGALGRDFEGATASAGTGLTLELVAGALLVGAGLARLLGPSGGGGARAREAAQTA